MINFDEDISHIMYTCCDCANERSVKFKNEFAWHKGFCDICEEIKDVSFMRNWTWKEKAM